MLGLKGGNDATKESGPPEINCADMSHKTLKAHEVLPIYTWNAKLGLVGHFELCHPIQNSLPNHW